MMMDGGLGGCRERLEGMWLYQHLRAFNLDRWTRPLL